MKLKLVREVLKEHFTIGRLYINDEFECYVMEDVDRFLEDSEANGNVKVKGETAIPLGTYNVIVNMSTRFRKLMPLLINVPQFEGIRIHAGNTHLDTEGCLLLGRIPGEVSQANAVLDSRVTYEAFFKKLRDAYDAKEKITISVERK